MRSPERIVWNILLTAALATSACTSSPEEDTRKRASGTEVPLVLNNPGPTLSAMPTLTPTRIHFPTPEFFQDQCRDLEIQLQKPRGWTLVENPFLDHCFISKEPVKKWGDMQTGMVVVRRNTPPKVTPLEYALALVTGGDTSRKPLEAGYTESVLGRVRVFGNHFETYVNNRPSDILMESAVIEGSRIVYLVWFIEPRTSFLQDYNQFGISMLQSLRIRGYPIRRTA